MDNATRKFLLQRHKQSGFPGSILDIIGQFEQQNNIQVAQTPQQQQQGLRPAHQAGNISQSMIFPNVPPNTPFNTVGMKAPINIEKYDEQGHLVKSYENVPPGVQNLPTGPQRGTVIETPANMQAGGELTFKQRVGNIKRDINSELLDGASWRAQSDARDAARDGIQGEGDSYRHILGSAYSVNALRRKGFGPITSMIAANALGLGHELTADSNNTLRESFEDITNNFAGSVLGLFNNDEQAKETAKKMVPYLPDGLPQEYGDRRYEGFQGQYQAGGAQDNTRVSMPTLPTTIPLDTSALQPPPDQGTIRQAGRAAPPNAMAFMPPGLQYNQMAAGKYIEENPLSNPVSLTAMGAFEAMSLPAFGASAPARTRQAINLSKDVMPESMQITKLQNQATRAVRGMRQADLDLVGDANRALRRGAAEHNLANRRVFDRANELVDEFRRADNKFTSQRDILLRNLEGLYRNPGSGGRTLRPGEAANRYTISATQDLTDKFVDRTMRGLTTNQAGGMRRYFRLRK
jgi:uncharacterized membrane protein (UPF0127 family)